MGFWHWLTNLFRRNKTAKGNRSKAPGKANGHTDVAKPNGSAKAPATDLDLQPQCAALTGSGAQCRRSARTGSKYCSSHKGYRPPTTTVAAAGQDTKPTVTAARDTAPTARGNSTSEASVRPQCGAITGNGDQCSRSARPSSKYCGIHKGYRPPTAAVAAKAKDTKPRTAKSRDTAPTGRRAHVSHNGYKLYQKGNRYYFSKKSQSEAKSDGAEPVYQMPPGRQVSETPNGLPVLKKA